MFEEPKSKHKAKIIQRIKQAEEIKEMYKKIRHMRRTHKQGVSRVQPVYVLQSSLPRTGNGCQSNW